MRARLHFTGATISDDLDAPALAGFGGAGRLAMLTVAATTDLALFATHPATHAQVALARALRTHRLDRGRVEAAVARSLALRAEP